METLRKQPFSKGYIIKQTKIMETENTLVLQFSETEEAVLRLIEETNDTQKYQVTRCSYDSESNEKSILVITMEVSKLSERDIRFLRRSNWFNK